MSLQTLPLAARWYVRSVVGLGTAGLVVRCDPCAGDLVPGASGRHVGGGGARFTEAVTHRSDGTPRQPNPSDEHSLPGVPGSAGLGDRVRAGRRDAGCGGQRRWGRSLSAPPSVLPDLVHECQSGRGRTRVRLGDAGIWARRWADFSRCRGARFWPEVSRITWLTAGWSGPRWRCRSAPRCGPRGGAVISGPRPAFSRARRSWPGRPSFGCSAGMRLPR